MNADKKQNRNSKEDTGSKIFTKGNNMIPCPINNGADLKADNMLENLFDTDGYIKREDINHNHTVLGFIRDIPFIAQYLSGDHYLRLACLDKNKWIIYFNIIQSIIHERLTDEYVEPDISYIVDPDKDKYYVTCFFYYNDKWIKENIRK